MIRELNLPLFLTLILLACGCSEVTSSSMTGDGSFATGFATGPSQPSDYRLSTNAQRVSDLIDRKSFSTAEQVLLRSLETDVSDAGLCVQFCRLYLLTRDLAEPGFVVSPFQRDKMEYAVGGEIASAYCLALELDPKISDYASDAVVRSLAGRLEEIITDNRGVIGTGNTLLNVTHGKWMHYDGFQISLTNVVWTVLEKNPRSCKGWAAVFENYAHQYAGKGKVASALAMGNIAGDMSQGGKGNRDYLVGTQCLFDALESYDWKSDTDWLKLCVENFPLFFRDELLEFKNGSKPDANYTRLTSLLAEHGYTIPSPSEVTWINQVLPTGAAPGK